MPGDLSQPHRGVLIPSRCLGNMETDMLNTVSSYNVEFASTKSSFSIRIFYAQVKLSDFGLSRLVDHGIMVSQSAALPVAW